MVQWRKNISVEAWEDTHMAQPQPLLAGGQMGLLFIYLSIQALPLEEARVAKS